MTHDTQTQKLVHSPDAVQCQYRKCRKTLTPRKQVTGFPKEYCDSKCRWAEWALRNPRTKEKRRSR